MAENVVACSGAVRNRASASIAGCQRLEPLGRFLLHLRGRAAVITRGVEPHRLQRTGSTFPTPKLDNCVQLTAKDPIVTGCFEKNDRFLRPTM
jgi:hypothetical protein